MIPVAFGRTHRQCHTVGITRQRKVNRVPVILSETKDLLHARLVSYAFGLRKAKRVNDSANIE